MMASLAEIVRLVGRRRRFLSATAQSIRGGRYAHAWAPRAGERAAAVPPNPLLDYFESHSSGRGIWKWRHYFESYERHFPKFVGQEVHLVEVGVYSGGSLDMWKAYPFVVVIQKCAWPRDELVAPKRGTEWQPFQFSCA